MQVIINYRNKSTGQLSFLVTAMTFGGYLNSRLQTKPVPRNCGKWRFRGFLTKNIILPMAPVTGWGPHRIYIYVSKNFLSRCELTTSSLIFIDWCGSFYDILSLVFGLRHQKVVKLSQKTHGSEDECAVVHHLCGSWWFTTTIDHATRHDLGCLGDLGLV